MSDEGEDRLTSFVDAFLLYLDGVGDEPSLEGFNNEERIEAEEIRRLLRASWKVGQVEVPAWENDPVAIRMGFVQPPIEFVLLNGKAVTEARKSQKITIAELARQLKELGVDVNTGWVFDLEQASSFRVDGGQARALAQVLKVPNEELAARGSSERQGWLDKFLSSPRFKEIIRRWALNRGQSAEDVGVWAAHRLATGPMRSRGEVSQEQLEAMLQKILETRDQ